MLCVVVAATNSFQDLGFDAGLGCARGEALSGECAGLPSTLDALRGGASLSMLDAADLEGTAEKTTFRMHEGLETVFLLWWMISVTGRGGVWGA